METGCATGPTKTSDTAKLHSEVVDGERGEGVFSVAASTKVLPVMDMSISGAFKAQFTIVIISG